MDERDRAALTLFAGEPIVAGRPLALGEDEANHARVRRVEVGERVRLIDGCGTVARGTLVRLGKREATVHVEIVEAAPAPPPMHLLVPIGDRERMLLLAEKAAELGAASWRPVMWHRSRSVSPRGEGVTFQGKVRARMAAALKQSGGAWLPTIYPDAPIERAIAATPEGSRLLLDAAGDPILARMPRTPVTVAIGPEGGLEPRERTALVDGGFAPVSLGRSVLRFETAGIVALGVIRAAADATSNASEGASG